MAETPPAPVAQELLLSINEDKLRSGNPDDLVSVFKDLKYALQRMYGDVADAINLSPEYQQAASQPLPAEGSFLIWDNPSPALGEPAVKLLYNNAGQVEELNRSASDSQQGLVELATDAEAQTGTDQARAVTPHALAAVTATTARRGLAEMATDAEAAAGTDEERYVNPKQLHANLPAFFPAGTKLPFYQAAAPTGWTQDTAVNDQVLRVVSGTGGGAGGSWTISGLTVAGHQLVPSEMPSHYHSYTRYYITVSAGSGSGVSNLLQNTQSQNTGSTGSDQAHSHGLSADGNWRPAYIDVIVASKD